MSAADVKTMLANPKYRQSGGRAERQGATGTCAHVGLKVDGTVARIPTACAGLVPATHMAAGAMRPRMLTAESARIHAD